jgi:hypothetical protein
MIFRQGDSSSSQHIGNFEYFTQGKSKREGNPIKGSQAESIEKKADILSLIGLLLLLLFTIIIIIIIVITRGIKWR